MGYGRGGGGCCCRSIRDAIQVSCKPIPVDVSAKQFGITESKYQQNLTTHDDIKLYFSNTLLFKNYYKATLLVFVSRGNDGKRDSV